MPSTVNLVVVRQRLSPPRMARYEADSGSLKDAIRLYEWNVEVSSLFYRLLHGVEVLLRNAINDQMVRWHMAHGLPGRWFDDPRQSFDSKTYADIAEAQQRIRMRSWPVTTDRLVSELNFGFWRYLLSRRYERDLWTPVLRHAFPHLGSQRRADIGNRVDRLRHLRNRIAHHEPIYPRRLDLDQRDALVVVAAICGDSRVWLEELSPISEVLARRP